MSGLSSSAWFTGDDGPADPPSERPVPPVAAPVSAARTLPVTPAERAASDMLRAWQAWPGTEMPIGEYTPYELFMLDVGDWLQELGLAEVETSALTPAGAALLARVEAAAEPNPTAAIVTFIRAEETKFRKAAAATGSSEAADRCAARASVLATVAAYIERGDHLAPPIASPPAKEPR